MKQIALSIEQMKHLQDLGLDTSDASMFYMWNNVREELAFHPSIIYDTEEQKEWFNTPMGRKSIYAYNLQDILEKLPWDINSNGVYYNLRIDENQEGWSVLYENDSYYHEMFSDTNLLEAAYQMLVWCIENEYIKVNKN